ncbi:MAG TPA: proton-conducting transporter membrane subunit [Leptospiraceae bacterium]|nr:proton-conducting transporter membrane subunit [Leptospiraceae bacterium]
MLKFLKFIIFAELFCSAGTALYLMTLPNPDAVSIIGLGLLSILGLPIYFSSGIFEDKGRPSRHIGFILFFAGQFVCLISGKSIWLPVFWELSSIGCLFFYPDENLLKKSSKSASAFLLSSGLSMFFISLWIFLPDSNFGRTSLLIGLLIKAAFSGFHVWYPIAHEGAPYYASASISGIMMNLPMLMIVKFLYADLHTMNVTTLIMILCGLGIFISGLSSYFAKDIRKSLAYSTIENSNFMILALVGASIWGMELKNKEIGDSFLFLFYFGLFHHSISKSFQFLYAGAMTEKAGSTKIDDLKGIGRTIGISPILSGIGAFSFALVPGTTGFFLESSFLYLNSKIFDTSSQNASVYLLVLFLSLTGLAMGSAFHLKFYLSTALSTRKADSFLPTSESESASLRKVFWYLGILIFSVPVFAGPVAVTLYRLNLMKNWLYTLSAVSLIVMIVSFLIYKFHLYHTVSKRQIWDCGSNHSGTEVSIPGSVFSDPVYFSVGRYFTSEEGEPYMEKYMQKYLGRFLNLGRYWIARVESGDVSQYILVSSVTFLFSIFLIFIFRNYFL